MRWNAKKINKQKKKVESGHQMRNWCLLVSFDYNKIMRPNSKLAQQQQHRSLWWIDRARWFRLIYIKLDRSLRRRTRHIFSFDGHFLFRFIKSWTVLVILRFSICDGRMLNPTLFFIWLYRRVCIYFRDKPQIECVCVFARFFSLFKYGLSINLHADGWRCNHDRKISCSRLYK